MENNSEAGSDSMLELEGVSVKEEGFEYPLPNAPRIDLSRQPLVEQLSSRKTHPLSYELLPKMGLINFILMK